jgi:hypothetical protein
LEKGVKLFYFVKLFGLSVSSVSAVLEKGVKLFYFVKLFGLSVSSVSSVSVVLEKVVKLFWFLFNFCTLFLVKLKVGLLVFFGKSPLIFQLDHLSSFSTAHNLIKKGCKK